ncbi:hypothetical protein Bca4012_096246 [Brassica carinata]
MSQNTCSLIICFLNPNIDILLLGSKRDSEDDSDEDDRYKESDDDEDEIGSLMAELNQINK